MNKILNINDIMDELENETLFNKLKRLDKLNNRCDLTNTKLIVLYNYINRYDTIRINHAISIPTCQLQVGTRNNNTRKKTTATFVIDYDPFNNLTLYVKKWHRKNRVFSYIKKSKIYRLDCLLFEV